jgi:hypothetical protein
MESLTLRSRVRLNGEVQFQEMQGEAVLLNPASGVYFGLNAVGTRIWQLLGECGLLSEVADRIAAEYDASPARCAADLLTLVADLEHHGLVRAESATITAEPG